jgi:6-phosphofructokinase 1
MDLTVDRLGPAKIKSPMKLSTLDGDSVSNFTPDDERVLYDISLKSIENFCADPERSELVSFERAGPREMIYFDPSKLRVGIVTCGGLCPGINNVIRGLVMELHYHYKVPKIYGFQYGFAGLSPEIGYPVINLTPDMVMDIHHTGGSILGSSRGPQDVEMIVDTLDRMDVHMLFTIGGDGTLKGADGIYQEVKRRGLKISIMGIPKTIDNDIGLVEKTFGFETAFSIAIDAIRAAHVEAKGSPNGIGLVRLMGRHSGYIAATAALAEPDVNYVIIPEAPFTLEGKGGLMHWLEQRLERRGHAVIVVAEGAGQDLIASAGEGHDASGNVKLKDIGLFLKEKIAQGLSERGIQHAIKYIDPSYIIRSAPALPTDSLFCSTLAQHAVHAGMSGRTGMLVGLWNHVFTHVPIREAVTQRKVVEMEGELWRGVLESTGQPTQGR